MELITKEIVAESPTDTVALYYLLGSSIGGKHVLFLVHSRQGRVVAVSDYTLDMVNLLADEIDGRVNLNPERKKARVEYVRSSRGDLAVELLKEQTTVRRDPSGNWSIHQKENANPNPTASSAITVYPIA